MKLSMICALALLGSAVSAAAQTLPADTKDLVAAAEREGTLNLVWSESNLGGADAVQKHAAAFNKEFGTHIDFKYAPGIEMARFGNQLYTEMQAGQPASSDVYVGAAAQLVPLLQRGLFLPVQWRKLNAKDVSEQDVEADGKALRIQSALSGVTYNTNLVDNPPRLLTDYLQPQWKNKIATTPYAAGYDVLAANDLWGPQRALDFVRKLSGQTAGLVRCGEVQRLATGEFSAVVMGLHWQYDRALARTGCAGRLRRSRRRRAEALLLYLHPEKRAASERDSSVWSLSREQSRAGRDVGYGQVRSGLGPRLTHRQDHR